VADHIVGTNQMIEIGKGGQQVELFGGAGAGRTALNSPES
jgi:hypothetical protein